MPLERGALALFLALLVWAPFPLGSNRAWAWTLLEAGLFLACALWVLGWMRGRHGSLAVVRAARPAFALLGLWLAWLALHFAPLPPGIVHALSPKDAELHALAVPYARGGWITLSVDPAASFAFWLKSCAYAVAFFLTLALGIGLMVGSLRETGARSWRQFWRDMAALLLSPRAPLRLFLVAMVVALVMTRSRMGNTAFFASLLVAGGIALAFSRDATRGTVILIASLIVIDITIVGAWFGVEKTVQRIEQTTVQDVEEREDPSAHALEMVRDYPLTGAGAGSFYTAFTRYRGPDLKAFYDFAHNDYIQFLAETGLTGTLLAGSLPVFALLLSLLALWRRRDPLARGFAFAVLMGVVSIGIHGTVDFNLQIPANALAFIVLLAYGWIAMYLSRDNHAERG